MSERAREFLDLWLSQHIKAVPEVQRLRETVRLAALCREDVIRAGIPMEELRAAAGDDLIRSLLAALESAAHRTDDAASMADTL